MYFGIDIFRTYAYLRVYKKYSCDKLQNVLNKMETIVFFNMKTYFSI